MSADDRTAHAVSVRELFLDTDDRYEIPPYQRNYTWGEEEISQLIRDIHDQRVHDPTSTYHLGNLVVAPKAARFAGDPGVTYEVIDGQQRLTTLFVLLAHLRAAEVVAAGSALSALEYEARPTATRVLDRLRKKDTALESGSENESGNLDEGIVRASRIIEQLIEAGTEDTSRDVVRGGETLELSGATAEYLLDRVKIIRMALPQRTNLNRYFEVMNTRGVQLAPVDIVKARLMRHLGTEDHRIFSEIWAGCSDMTRYVQMSFAKRDTGRRTAVFGDDWSELQGGDFNAVKALFDLREEHQPPEFPGGDSLALDRAIKEYAVDKPQSLDREFEERELFTSQVSFEVFLLHVLAVTAGDEDGDRQLDDKKLVERFRKLLDVQTDKRGWVKQFAWDLLHCRLLFDGVIIKRDANLRPGEDSTSDSEGGDWSLKALKKTVSGKEISATYRGTFGADVEDEHRTGLSVQSRLILLQSALRTTYTSPRTMHWITEVLGFARENHLLGGARESPAETGAQLLEFLENRVRERVRRAMHSGEDGGFPLGFAIPRILFTYLDYLLVRNADLTDFRFVYRTSIEHFSPQNRDPEKDWTDFEPLAPESLHSFGNLALVSVQVNSKFSNSTPREKAAYPELPKQSRKLTMMCMQVRGDGSHEVLGPQRWSKAEIDAHNCKMVKLLEDDVALLPSGGE